MLKGLIGKKIGMTRLFLDEGRAVPVTVLQVGPCTVVQVKTPDKEQYSALQLGFGEKKAARVNKPAAGHFAKAGVESRAVLKEFRVDDTAEFQVGQEFTADMFARGEKVNVTGRTKGRGFSGVVKRHGFSGGRKTHGCTTHDLPGSIGQSADPARVVKGRRMPGRYGNDRMQARNLKVVDVRPEDNLVLVRGAVPGARGGIVFIEKA
ncbi:MAG: 50S ribosomal protein L3 [Proteobacteria bacterium]|nr:50S ribosomal protein L3 [Pseudomonadota bacterium]MBU1452797.1 50S ribosomal protein L3 [Pseudomonadota bacterium]MBU2470303.1 50S ribosomal protein L3 [Pseudomonadota bacterium]MBU2518012.1 50S ribosomal protein L3 [Pseudomonadota bacterium]